MSKIVASDPHIALDVDLVEALEAFIEERDAPPAARMSWNEAINVVLRDWLTGQGYLALPDEEIVPALEAANVPK